MLILRILTARKDSGPPSASNIIDMNTDALKKSATEAKEAAQDFMNSPQVQGAIDKGKEALEKGKEWLSGPEVRNTSRKAKKCLKMSRTKWAIS